MRKITNLELSSFIIIILVTQTSGIIFNILKTSTGINSYLPLIISFFLGFIILKIILYISNYKPELSIYNKLKTLNIHILNIFISIILLVIAITLLYNTSNFITSQLLFRTPNYYIYLLVLLLSIYTVSLGINSISKLSFLLTIFNIILYIITLLSLIKYVNIENFYPILKDNTNNMFITSIKITAINIIPLILILSIPKNNIDKKYNKSIIISYILGFILSFGVVFITYGVLDKYLVNIYEYPEYMVLRKISLFGFLERIENIINNQWLIGSFLYITFILYYLSSAYKIIISKKNISIYVFSIIIFILTIILFKNNTVFHNYIINYYPYIIMSLFIIIIIIFIMVFARHKYMKMI